MATAITGCSQQGTLTQRFDSCCYTLICRGRALPCKVPRASIACGRPGGLLGAHHLLRAAAHLVSRHSH
eukprot:scaffold681424_cov64-Prasinocladus_malaysianus.AAC.1